MAVTMTGTGVVYSDATTQTAGIQGPASGSNKGQLLAVNAYTTAGTFTWSRPTGATRVVVQVVGGGGGGAGYCESGGAGGYAEGTIDVTSVASVTVTVGGGGAKTTYYAAASDGGTSSFGAYCTATGGYGANRNASHTGGHGGVGGGASSSLSLTGGSGVGHHNSASHFTGGYGGNSFFGGSAGHDRNHTNQAVTWTTKQGSGAAGAGGPGSQTDAGGYPGYINIGGNGEVGAVMVYSFR